ncbi:hypothetical protein [Streptomyces sp. NPDC059639]|uniref:hypothetical protein n=1 Tax=Streptomyces sp. NPDC059639 TaxID=3346891 RepID=UPI0036D1A7D5
MTWNVHYTAQRTAVGRDVPTGTLDVEPRARVHTWVAGTNTAMLAVDRRFGFRRVDSEVGVQRRLD